MNIIEIELLDDGIESTCQKIKNEIGTWTPMDFAGVAELSGEAWRRLESRMAKTRLALSLWIEKLESARVS